jgi:hypothetical protein
MREEFQASQDVNTIDNLKDENFIEGVHFNYFKSSTSIHLDEIKAMIFGGTSARFWLSRKHMISDVNMYK